MTVDDLFLFLARREPQTLAQLASAFAGEAGDLPAAITGMRDAGKLNELTSDTGATLYTINELSATRFAVVVLDGHVSALVAQVAALKASANAIIEVLRQYAPEVECSPVSTVPRYACGADARPRLDGEDPRWCSQCGGRL